MPQTNVLLVFADQMRGQAMGCAGNAVVQTPTLDRLAAEGVRFSHAYCHSPVCTPSRGTLLTGLFPLAHRAYVNDMPIRTDAPSLGTLFRDAGYATGYVGKWHLDGCPRGKFTPPGPRRLGFDDLWAVHNCTHAYLDSFYYRDTDEKIPIDGYEPEHQTALAQGFIRDMAERPWCLTVSYGTPHDPYGKVPEKWKSMYRPEDIELRPNVPAEHADQARRDLAGYYAHTTALDEFVGRLLATLEQTGQADRTLVVFTSDHGDMHGSQGMYRKQKPWEESVNIPLIWRLPAAASDAPAGRTSEALFGIADILPTIIGLTGVGSAEGMHGRDLSAAVRGAGEGSGPDEIVIHNPAFTGIPGAIKHDFTGVLMLDPVPVDDGWDLPGWWGLRTRRWTYARTLEGPWVLYDNDADPYQMSNLADAPELADLRADLDARLEAELERVGEPMRPRPEIIRGAGLVDLWNERELHLRPPDRSNFARLL